MKISRRKLLVGSTAATLAGLPDRSPLGATGETQFIFGKLGGGGFADNLALAPDGSSLLVRGNLPNSYQWRRDSNECINISTSPYMDGLQIGVMGYGTPYAHAYGPNSQRIALITGVIPPRLGVINFGEPRGQFYRSDNGGNSWSKPGGTPTGALTFPFSCAGGNIYQGPQIVFDPLNNDIIWVMGWNGAVAVTYNGGVTWHAKTDLMDAAGLPKCTAADSTSTCGYRTINCRPNNPINGRSGTWGVFNATAPFTIGGSYGDTITGGNATTVNVYGYICRRDGTYGTYRDPGVQSGDVLYFGLLGGIAIDPSLGSVSNPGIELRDRGASGVASKLIYFAWQSGAASLIKTEDGGTTFSAVGSGGPTGAGIRRLKLSNDATLGGGGNNVLYLSDGTKFWRWARTHPAGSSLTDNTWTSWTGLSIFGAGVDHVACLMVPDPLTQGRVVFFNLRGQQSTSLSSYGDSRVGFPANINTDGDTPWLHTDDKFMGDAEFDRVTPNKIWIADGVGLWWFTNPNNSSKTTWHSKMQPGLQSLIPVQVTKVPAPNGRVIITAQDRNLITSLSPTTAPTGYYPQPLVAPSSGFSCWALDDPNRMFASVVELVTGTDGNNWTAIGTWRALGNNPISTVSGQSTVTITHANHGKNNGDRVGIANLTDFNGITLNNNVFTVTVVNSNSYTVQSSTAANATGSGGGLGTNGTGVRAGKNGYTGGGGGSVCAKTTRQLFNVGGNGALINYGTTLDDVNWSWTPTLFNGNPIKGWGGNAFGKNKQAAIELTSGKIGYIEPYYGSPAQVTQNSFFVSRDGGATLTCPGGVGNLLTNWGGYQGAGNSSQLAAVLGYPTHWLYAQGRDGGGTVTITTQYLRRTRDDGVSWEGFTNTKYVQAVCVGPSVTGAAYPAVYIVGLANSDVFPNWGIYRSDDMSPTGPTCTWKRLDAIKKVNCDGWAGGLAADFDVPGKFYLASDDTGYCVGFL